MKRLSSLSFLVLLLAVSLLFIVTCKKEYSYEGGRPAEYNFVGSPDTCTDAVVLGNYYTGIATDVTDSILLNVTVTTPGNFDIATNLTNGISFSVSGSFTDTGLQAIVLKASGTPVAPGDFQYLIPGTGGCSFSVIVTNQLPASYVLSGAPNDCSDPVEQGVYMKGIAMISSNVITINVDVASEGPYSITTDKVNGISFSGSGSFTSTGAQQVILKATGTPEEAELSRFALNADSSQCSFYLPVSNSEPVATYVLQSSMGVGGLYCVPGSVQGSYTAGTPLYAGNTLTVNAYVTVPGNYTISTIEINGMKFSASGTFADIGPQDVVLRGSGTPVSVGFYTFNPQIVGPAPLGGVSCGLDVDVK